MKKQFLSLASVLAFCMPVAGYSADSYPAQPMSWVVPLAAGGPADTLTRNIASQLSKQLSATIVIENVSGAGGTVGAARAARSSADGYHFLMGHMGFMGAAPSLYKTLRYDPVKDFKAVVRFPDTPAVLLVPETSAFKNIRELIAHAKANPGKVNFGTAGVGSVSHLMAELFAASAGITVETVPYRGNAPALADLMAGRLHAVFDQSNTSLSNVASGRVKALGVGSLEPMKQLPGVPTIASVIPGFEATTWYGLYAPAGTSDAAVKVIQDAYLTIMADPAFAEKLVAQGVQPLAADKYTSDSLQRLTATEVDRWAALIKAAGIQPQ